MLNKLIVFVGTCAASSAGWWLGSRVGFMAGFFLSVAGGGAGFYVTKQLLKRYVG